MLNAIMKERTMNAKAVVGFYEAFSNGEDIVLVEGEKEKIGTLFCLRQQEKRDDKQGLISLADFISTDKYFFFFHLSLSL